MARIDYTSRDYQSIRQAMIDLIPSKLPEWTDHSETDAGIVILELLASQLEMLSYYNDRVANEVFLPTATQRKSVINLCKLLGYELAWHTASRHMQVFEFEPQPVDTLIPKGFQLGTKSSDIEESIIFETLEDLIIPAGKTGLEKDADGEYLYAVEIEHGQTITDDLLQVIDSDMAFQTMYLSYSPVLKDSIFVRVENESGSTIWTPVSDFISSNQDSENFIIEMDEYDKIFIQFGNGISGRIPPIGSTIFANYRVGGGTDGNVGSMTIIEYYQALPGLLQTFNPFGPHVLGKNNESIEVAKSLAPKSLKRLERYVTLDDYENGVLLDYPTVKQAKAINDDGAVDLYLVGADGQPLTLIQKQELEAIIEEKKIMFTNVTLLDPNFVDIAIDIEITPYDNVIRQNIKYEAENRIRDIFDPNTTYFGMEVPIGVLQKELFSISGVRNVKILAPTSDVIVTETSIPRLASLSIKVGGL